MHIYAPIVCICVLAIHEHSEVGHNESSCAGWYPCLWADNTSRGYLYWQLLFFFRTEKIWQMQIEFALDCSEWTSAKLHCESEHKSTFWLSFC